MFSSNWYFTSEIRTKTIFIRFSVGFCDFDGIQASVDGNSNFYVEVFLERFNRLVLHCPDKTITESDVFRGQVDKRWRPCAQIIGLSEHTCPISHIMTVCMPVGLVLILWTRHPLNIPRLIQPLRLCVVLIALALSCFNPVLPPSCEIRWKGNGLAFFLISSTNV